MASESQIQSLMRSHGMTREQAIAHNQSAVSQGMDLNGDGFVTGNEYLSWKQGARPGGGGNSHRPAPTPAPSPRPSPTPTPTPTPAPKSGYEQHIEYLMRHQGMSRDQAIAHNQSAIDQGMDLNGDGYATDDEYLQWKKNNPAPTPTATNPSHQEAKERAHNYSQNEADAASAQQQYDQSIAEWEEEYAKRDQQYTDDVNKLHDDYQTQFEDFEKATALAMQDKPKSNYDRLKEGTLGGMSAPEGNKFGNFDPTKIKRREYDFS